jgi:hypothetical protein
VQAHIEVMPAAQPESAAVWRPLGAAATLATSSPERWRYHWTGQVRIADRQFLSLRWRRRLVIQEFEPFDSGSRPELPLADRSRLIFAHTVPI